MHLRTSPPRRVTILGLSALLAGAMTLPGATSSRPAVAAPAEPGPLAASTDSAAGAPGQVSHFDLARKDCVGTARNTTSKVWYTVANGVLSDVYEPTVDTTNVETMQFVVTDGKTFTDLQTRDATYTVRADATGMACTVTTTAKTGAWRLVTTYFTDPTRDAVLVHTRLHGLTVPTHALHLYTRLDPTVGGNGGGGTDNAGADNGAIDYRTGSLVAYDTNTTTAAANRNYAVPTYLSLQARRGFKAATTGYVGTASDGLSQLDAHRRLTRHDANAPDGNVVDVAELHLNGSGKATLALGFGRTQRAAVRVSHASLHRSTRATLRVYEHGWAAYDARLNRPPRRQPGLSPSSSVKLAHRYYLGANIVKASEDKTFPGAIVAGLASPWGQAVSAGDRQNGKAPYFGSYREVFSRDLYEAFTALLVDGDLPTARAATRFLLERQQLPDGRLPRNSLLNGKSAPDTGGDQLDETADPILMAWQSGLGADRALYTQRIRPATDFLVAHGPSFGSERWEEQSGYSPSTIAAEIAGLVAAGKIANRHGDTARSRLYLATADHFQRSVKGWTVTTSGPYADRYFIRLSKTGDPDAAISYNLGNGSVDIDQRSVVDAGFLELTRLGILPANDPDVQASLPVVDEVLRRHTPSGASFYRYGTDTPGSEDGYGDCHVPDPTDCLREGQPWPTTDTGSGHLWPVLSGERAEQELQTGHDGSSADLLRAMSRLSSGVGLVPEQAWENPAVPAAPYGSDPTTASIGFVPGRPAGSAAPLTWAQAQQVRLIPSLAAGRPLEQPRITRSRYVDHAPPRVAHLSVTAPTAGADVTTADTEVAGSTAARARVVVSATHVDTGGSTAIASTIAAADGSFLVKIPTGFGTNTLTTTVTTRAGATGYDQRTVTSEVVTGTTVLDVTDPTGDDHGPGTFQYPSATDFHQGAFDLTRFEVVDSGQTIYLRAKVGDLTPTFGDPLGAQLLTVFVHQPGTDGSGNSLYPSRNYGIAAQDAWARAIQVRGFDQTRVFDPSGSQIGTATASASQASGYITIAVPAALLEASPGSTPGPGWSFTVTLYGADGYGVDGARTFAPTAQPYQFGRCATAGDSDPRCAVPLNELPKVMDTITPTGVNQSSELDPTSPVMLLGVSVPAKP